MWSIKKHELHWYFEMKLLDLGFVVQTKKSMNLVTVFLKNNSLSKIIWGVIIFLLKICKSNKAWVFKTIPVVWLFVYSNCFGKQTNLSCFNLISSIMVGLRTSSLFMSILHCWQKLWYAPRTFFFSAQSFKFQIQCSSDLLVTNFKSWFL